MEEQSFKTEVSETLDNEIIIAKHEFKMRWTELVVTLLALVAGVALFCLNLVDLLGLSLIVLGALWNFFTDSNKFFACIMAFLMCVAYGFIAGGMKIYGHAFLHILFYLPTQLIYYYETNKEDNAIKKDKKLTQNGYIGTVVCFWLMAFGLGIVLYKVGDPFYIMDALSSTLLVVSVFLVNGKYREYYPVRVFATTFATIMWTVIGIKTGFAVNTAIFVTLFAMYTVMDSIKWVRWSKN